MSRCRHHFYPWRHSEKSATLPVSFIRVTPTLAPCAHWSLWPWNVPYFCSPFRSQLKWCCLREAFPDLLDEQDEVPWRARPSLQSSAVIMGIPCSLALFLARHEPYGGSSSVVPTHWSSASSCTSGTQSALVKYSVNEWESRVLGCLPGPDTLFSFQACRTITRQ